ncbi:hypothetical protein QE152_g24290 [Popillia japonica]|uniref:Uncharacterized protein n=1 Tax=Popillia japonica TaxID=7064 RepID=A0AAW1KGI4_POPJA
MELFGKSYIGCTSGVYPLNKNRFTDAEYIEEATKMQMPSLHEIVLKKKSSGNKASPPKNSKDSDVNEQAVGLEVDLNKPSTSKTFQSAVPPTVSDEQRQVSAGAVNSRTLQNKCSTSGVSELQHSPRNEKSFQTSPFQIIPAECQHLLQHL